MSKIHWIGRKMFTAKPYRSHGEKPWVYGEDVPEKPMQ
jgi:hypothetical protein